MKMILMMGMINLEGVSFLSGVNHLYCDIMEKNRFVDIVSFQFVIVASKIYLPKKVPNDVKFLDLNILLFHF
jgi:hypothetical protein